MCSSTNKLKVMGSELRVLWCLWFVCWVSLFLCFCEKLKALVCSLWWLLPFWCAGQFVMWLLISRTSRIGIRCAYGQEFSAEHIEHLLPWRTSAGFPAFADWFWHHYETLQRDDTLFPIQISIPGLCICFAHGWNNNTNRPSSTRRRFGRNNSL